MKKNVTSFEIEKMLNDLQVMKESLKLEQIGNIKF